MKEILKQTRFLFLVAIGFLAFFFLLELIDLTSSLYGKAANVHPVFGYISLVIMLGGFGGFLFVPLGYILRMPAALKPPAETSGPAYELYLKQLKQRLASNIHLRKHNIIP